MTRFDNDAFEMPIDYKFTPRTVVKTNWDRKNPEATTYEAEVAWMGTHRTIGVFKDHDEAKAAAQAVVDQLIADGTASMTSRFILYPISKP